MSHHFESRSDYYLSVIIIIQCYRALLDDGIGVFHKFSFYHFQVIEIHCEFHRRDCVIMATVIKNRDNWWMFGERLIASSKVYREIQEKKYIDSDFLVQICNYVIRGASDAVVCFSKTLPSIWFIYYCLYRWCERAARTLTDLGHRFRVTRVTTYELLMPTRGTDAITRYWRGQHVQGRVGGYCAMLINRII